MNDLRLDNWERGERLKTFKDVEQHVAARLKENDMALFTAALGDAARCHGMKQLGQDTGISRVSLHRSLSGKADPRLSTILKVIDSLGLQLKITSK